MHLNDSFSDRCSSQIILNRKFVGVILNFLKAKAFLKENIETSKGQTLQKSQGNDPSSPPGTETAFNSVQHARGCNNTIPFECKFDHLPNCTTSAP